MPDRSNLTILFALLQCACGYPQFGFSAPEPTTDATPDTDRVSVDSAFDAPPETPPRPATCDGVDADLCDDFERGTVSSKWEGVEATGGLLTVVDAGLDSQFALSAAKPFAGAAHIMTKASAHAVTGFRDSFAARVVRAPSDPGLGAFVTLGNVKGRSGFGIALFPQPGGVSNADLFVLKGARVRLGVVPVGVWTKFKVEVECTATCTARAQLTILPGSKPSSFPTPTAARMLPNSASIAASVAATGRWNSTTSCSTGPADPRTLSRARFGCCGHAPTSPLPRPVRWGAHRS